MSTTDFSNTTLILGFFDGIHIGHKKVIESAVKFAKGNKSKTILLTFPNSPAEYFNNNPAYIYERNLNYELIKRLGVSIINETNFESLVNISASDYLKYIVSEYKPRAIFTGFNYTFGKDRIGNTDFLAKGQSLYDYKYFCIDPVIIDDKVVSSTLIKELLSSGLVGDAAKLLGEPFSLKSIVIRGNQLGRTIGFPTANMVYPDNIIRLPFGVYKVETMERTAILNWGIKPTFEAKTPMLEVYIPNFDGDLYGKELEMKLISKIRDEKRFSSLAELKLQITKDVNECLK